MGVTDVCQSPILLVVNVGHVGQTRSIRMEVATFVQKCVFSLWDLWDLWDTNIAAS